MVVVAHSVKAAGEVLGKIAVMHNGLRSDENRGDYLDALRQSIGKIDGSHRHTFLHRHRVRIQIYVKETYIHFIYAILGEE